MKRLPVIIIAIAIVGALLFYMLTFTVQYNQVAVRSTLGSVDERSVIDQPGIHYRFPVYHTVFTYPTTLQLLDKPATEIQTTDGYSVIVRMFITYKVDNPLTFTKTTRTLGEAEQRILATMSEGPRAVLANYQFSDLVNNDPSKVKLDEIEAKCLEVMRTSLTSASPNAANDMGILIESFGIRSLQFPEAISEKVFERMVASREALAANTREEGQTQANDIRSKAEQIAERIRAFANSQASEIKAEGEAVVAEQIATFTENPKLGEFLLRVEMLEQALASGQATFILSGSELSALDLLIDELLTKPEDAGN
ncbi:MAG: SPFH domain-containing protein [Planctomycetota bacterium]